MQLICAVRSQSVAQNCLNLQIRENLQGIGGENLINNNQIPNEEINNNANNNNNEANENNNLQRAEDVTIAAFESICR